MSFIDVYSNFKKAEAHFISVLRALDDRDLVIHSLEDNSYPVSELLMNEVLRRVKLGNYNNISEFYYATLNNEAYSYKYTLS